LAEVNGARDGVLELLAPSELMKEFQGKVGRLARALKREEASGLRQ